MFKSNSIRMKGNTRPYSTIIRSLTMMLMFCQFNLIAQTDVQTEIVSGIWEKSASPFHIYNNIEVQNGETLEIDPGVEIIFHGHFILAVNGRLLAQGNREDSISFSSIDNDNKWHSIRFENTSVANDSSLFDYCKIENTFYFGGSVITNGGNAFYIENFDKVRISNSLIQNNNGGRGAGIFIDNSNIVISQNVIRNNKTAQYGAGINVLNASPLISNNTISGNYANDNGGGIYFRNSQSLVTNNRIENNSCYWTGAGLVLANSDIKLIRNIISNNISDHSNGGGLAIFSSSPTIVNNTICYNRAEEGEGVYINGESRPDFINDIIFGNRDRYENYNLVDEIFLDSDDSDPNFYNCNIQGGIEGIVLRHGTLTGIAKNNINLLPIFKDTLNFDYTLTWENYPVKDKTMSPCIDAGLLSSAHDTDGSNSDLGAISYFQEDAIFPPRVDFEADTLLGFEKLAVEFLDKSYKGTKNINSWFWEFGDGSTSSKQNPLHTYENPGIYDVSLTITDESNFSRKLLKKAYVHVYKGTYLIGEVEGRLSEDRYLIGGNLTVADKKKLIIDKGVELVFFGNYSIEVLGTLKAKGSEVEEILFTYYDTLGLDLGVNRFDINTGGWAGIKINPSQDQFDSTVLDFCHIKFVSNSRAGALNILGANASVRISNCDIGYNSNQGISCFGDNLIIRDNYIHHNYVSGGIYSFGGSPTIANNIICQNIAGVGGGIQVKNARPKILNNVICHNTAGRGGGIADYEGWLEIVNNTICYNHSSWNEGGGYYTLYAGKTKFINSIISKNTPSQINIADQYTELGFEFSILEGGQNAIIGYAQNVFSYENVIEQPANLASEINAHCRPLPNALSIDAGTLEVEALNNINYDLIGNPRVKNSKIDIGAYEYEITEPITLVKKIGSKEVDEDFGITYLNLDSIFAYHLGNHFVTYSISNFESIEYVKADLIDNHLRLESKPNLYGNINISLFATDGVNEGIYDTLFLNVNSINDAPFFTLDSNLILEEDFEGNQSINITFNSVPYGEENQTLSYSFEPDNNDFVNIDIQNDALLISAIENAYGNQDFILTVDDGQGVSSSYSQSFSVIVSPINDFPIIPDIDDLEIQAGHVLNFPLIIEDFDKEEVSLTINSEDQTAIQNSNILISRKTGNEFLIEIFALESATGSSRLKVIAEDAETFMEKEFTMTVLSNITSIDQLEFENNYAVFPNPVEDILHIRSKYTPFEKLTLYTLMGQIVLKKSTSQSYLDLKNVKKGIYLLEIENGNSIELIKILKK